MKSICITGAIQSDLDNIAHILNKAGMKSPALVQRDEPTDLAYWHEQVTSIATEDSDNVHPIASPGRLWERLASDIFIANLKSKVWGWADTRSTWLLDFWLNFEPRLNFILVCASPEQMLADTMVTGTDIAPVDTIMDTWQAQHQQMLRFYHRNPQRCLLVEARDCIGHPEALIQRCANQWKMPLEKTANPAINEINHGALALYLAQQIAQGYPQTAGLQQELDATITRLDASEKRPTHTNAPDPARIIADYRTLCDHSAELQKALATQRIALEKDLAVLKARLDDTKTQDRQQQHELSTKLKESGRENELLLLQLHQVQEELEHYFLQHQNVQKQLKSAEDRWQRMLQRTPDYCDYTAIEVVNAEEAETGTITWRLKNLDAAGRTLPELEFSTIVEYGIAGFVLTRQPGTTGPLIRWPSTAANMNELMLIPIGRRDQIQLRFETLFDLATRDWDLIRTLTRLLASTLEAPAALNASNTPATEALRGGLSKLGQVIEKFPATFRYDRVNLKRTQVNHDYEHLWLHFENLAFGKQRWPEFEFRLACANLRPNHFGSHPKLEFPENSGQAPFDTWFIETYDDFGAKLELRFALPESMDLNVWQRLSNHDHNFLAALIARLPAILATLQGTGVKLDRSWDDWTKMVDEIQRIITLRIAPAGAARNRIADAPTDNATGIPTNPSILKNKDRKAQ
ncbi:MAG: hypothetical protein LZF61_08555 [Nitrosomonas sp.]|nr:MAG: hypothetical protein LZF61_08555 [Nitrosomonas sp.]